MAINRYIGARYVPKFAEPIVWDKNNDYEPLTIVQYEGNSYTSKQAVPAGIELTNEAYWAVTGNYNAQIEGYRKDAKAALATAQSAEAKADDAIEQATTQVTNETARAKAAEQANADSIIAETARAKAAEQANADSIIAETARAKAAEQANADSIVAETARAKAAEQAIVKQLGSPIGETFRFKVLTRDAKDHSYLYSNPPEPAWDSIQGVCWTKNGKYAATFSPGLVYYRQNNTQYLNTAVIREYNADGTVSRESAPIKMGHANSITYNPTTNEFLVANNYQLAGDSAETRNESNLISRVDYDTLTKIDDVAVDAIGTVCNCVSCDAKSGKIYAFNTDIFTFVELDATTYAVSGDAKIINGYKQFYNDTASAFDASRRQSTCVFGDYVVCNTYMPNMFLFFRMDNLDVVEKYAACEDMYSCEAEDFDIDNDGNIVIGFHKRFYNRLSTQEYVSNIYSIDFSNIYSNGYNYDWANGTAVSAQRYIDINPSTNNTIQNGSTTYPCKTFMEAYWLWLRSEGKQLAIRVQSGATGNIIAVRFSYCDLYIDDNSNGGVTWNNNMRTTAGRIVLDGLTFNNVSGKDAVAFPFSTSQGNPSASNCQIQFYECNQKASSGKFGVSNCIYINTNKNFTVEEHNRNITVAAS